MTVICTTICHMCKPSEDNKVGTVDICLFKVNCFREFNASDG